MTKCGIIDIRAKINNKNEVDIEMQVADQSSMIERILFYWSRMYVKQIEKGEDYTLLNRCISVIFLEHGIAHLQALPAHTKWQIKESKNGKILLTDRLEINIIELEKEPKSEENKEIKKWLTFFKNPYGEEIRKMADENEKIKVALDGLEKINADKEKVRIAELREKYILDRNTEIKVAEAKGKEEGIELGKQVGKQEGVELGKYNEKIKMAKKMKQKGMDTKAIMELTELTKEEVENLE